MHFNVGGSTVNSSVVTNVAIRPYSVLVTETAVSVGLVLVLIATLSSLFNHVVFFRNSSTGGQNIRVGTTGPAFSTAGFLLQPNDAIVMDALQTVALRAIADAAGGLLDVVIYRTN